MWPEQEDVVRRILWLARYAGHWYFISVLVDLNFQCGSVIYKAERTSMTENRVTVCVRQQFAFSPNENIYWADLICFSN